MATTQSSRFAQIARERQSTSTVESNEGPLDPSINKASRVNDNVDANGNNHEGETSPGDNSEGIEVISSPDILQSNPGTNEQVVDVPNPAINTEKSNVRGSPKDRLNVKMKLLWNDSWIFEQERRSNFERKLQSNEAWWPAGESNWSLFFYIVGLDSIFLFGYFVFVL